MINPATPDTSNQIRDLEGRLETNPPNPDYRQSPFMLVRVVKKMHTACRYTNDMRKEQQTMTIKQIAKLIQG
jgi:hypothetical protein